MSILNLEISNTGPESYRTATCLTFPTTDEHLRRKLEEAQIDDARNGARNEIVYCNYSWLRPHIPRDADLHEVNLLTDQLQNHIPNELDIFKSMIQIEMERNGGQPIPLPRLINMTYSTPHVVIAPDISNDADLGEFLFENDFIDGADADALEARIEAGQPVTDFYAMLGKEHREGMGVITEDHIYMEWDGDMNEEYVPEYTASEPEPETVSIGDIYSSPDFQCDQTSGYPTVLVWNQDNGTAILQPAPAFNDDSEEANQCIRDCADWGIYPCSSWEDYNNLLETIGMDAVRNAYVSDDDESEEFGGLTLS